jgi:hypothetical protein
VTVQQFNLFIQARPFQPFAIHLADGRSFPVRHPEMAMLIVQGRIVWVINKDGLTEVVDMILVISLRPLTDEEFKSSR